MEKNMGQVDRALRAVIGIIVIVLGAVNQNWLGAIGLIPLLTAGVGFCPLYKLLGIKTCSEC
ncbi:YgaP family membrane protein [Chlorobium sp.]|uniref:YgaP family membrane protein n=1 Tax=Chlorobium sp. TaxID=1095 RepID=UPI002F424007